MFYDSMFREDTKAVIEVLKSQREKNVNRQVFFYLFCLPGTVMHPDILNYYQRFLPNHFGTTYFVNKSVLGAPNIRGAILVSPLVMVGNSENTVAAVAIEVRNSAQRVALRSLAWTMFHVSLLTSSKWIHYYLKEYVRSIPLKIPQLVLYSRADLVVSHENITDYVIYQRSIGNNITSKMWENSSHVLHYKEHPEEYTHRETLTQTNIPVKRIFCVGRNKNRECPTLL